MQKQKYGRNERISDQIHREISQIIFREIRDPRVGLVTLTSVEVSAGLEYAKVFVTHIEDEDNTEKDRIELINILNSASGFIRTNLARRISLRCIPQLKFFYDKSVQYGSYISKLIEESLNERQVRVEKNYKNKTTVGK